MRRIHVFDNDKNDFNFRYAVNGAHAKTVHGHDFFEFFLTLNDGVLHRINGKEQILHNDMLVFIRPQDKHYFLPMDGIEPRHINLAFRKEIVYDLFTYLGDAGEALRHKLLEPPMPPVCVLTERELRRVIETLNRFNAFELEEKAELRLSLRFSLAEIFSLFEKKITIEEEKEDNVPQWLEVLCEKMCSHENFSGGISKMVELSGKTREHLARSLKKYKNITASAFVNNLRLEYVANMLVNSDMNIIDLCFESGFSSLDYFGKQFRKKYGMPPSKFRVLMKEERF